MKILLALMVMLMLSIMACAPTPAPVEQDNTGEQLEQLEEQLDKDLENARQEQEQLDKEMKEEPAPVVEPEDIDVEEKKEVEQQLDASWKQTLLASLGEIINKAEEKSAKGYTFVYTTSDSVADYGKFYVKGDKVRLDLYDEKMIPDSYDKLNVVYVDNAKGTADAYCDIKVKDSPIDCSRNMEAEYEVHAGEFLITMPYEILATIDTATERGPAKVGSRNTIAADVEYTDGDSGVIWLDQFSGLPVQMEKDGMTFYYNSLTVGVADSTFEK